MEIDRNTGNRAAINGSPYVNYDETTALLWLGKVAADYDVDGQWPHRGEDDRLIAVTNLVEAAVIAKVIRVDNKQILSVGYEFVADRGGPLAGARLLVCTPAGLELVDDAVWASEIVDDEFGCKGALNALWNTAWGVHNLMTKLAKEATQRLLIASGTNPWVSVAGEPYDWQAQPLPAAPNDCDQCAESPIPGAIPAMDTPVGIQCCDQCKRIPGDLEAAAALAALVGGQVRFEAAPQ